MTPQDLILGALKDSYQDFSNDKADKGLDPEAYALKGWCDPDEKIITQFKNAIDKMSSGEHPQQCITEFELSSPPRKVTLSSKYTENMAKLSKKMDSHLFKLPYSVSVITGNDLQRRSQELNEIRIFGNESYALIYTIDENGDLFLWNVFEL